MNEKQIQKLLEYITPYGPVYSIFEQKTINGFTPNLLQKLQFFIEFGPEEQVRQTLKEQLKYDTKMLERIALNYQDLKVKNKEEERFKKKKNKNKKLKIDE